MFTYQRMYAVVNNEDHSEFAFESVDRARNELVALADQGIDAQMFPVSTVTNLRRNN